MQPKDIVMPVIALVAGLISLYVDPKDKAKQWMLVFALLVTAGFTVWFNRSDANDKTREVEQAQAREMATQKSLDEARAALHTIEGTLQTQGGWIQVLCAQFGNVSCKEAFVANDIRQQIIAARAPAPAAEPITLEYFPKGVDGAAVRRGLQEVHLDVVEKAPLVTGTPTNAMWFGNDVPLDRVKLAALTLQRAGVQLKAIRRFRDGSGRHRLLIQVGADTGLKDAPVLTPADVQALNEQTVARDTGSVAGN
jgi:hypothetical protein